MNCLKRLIKREAEFKQICKEEAEKEVSARYDEITRETTYQALQVAFYVLAKEFKFGKKRLTLLKNLIENEFFLMESNFLNLNYNATDCGRFLKEKFGIDFSESQYNTHKE